MPDQGGEKTEKATGKKRQDERKKGNVFVSKDVTTVVTLITSFYIMSAFISNFIEQAQINFHNQFARAIAIDTITTSDVTNIFIEVARIVVTTVLPPIIIIGFVAVIVTGIQTRFIFTREAIKFKLSRINPLQGIQKLFSLRSLVELLKSLLKTTIIVSILYSKIMSVIYTLPALMDFEIVQAAAYTGDTIMSLLLTVGIAFCGVAAGDFMYQRWEYEKNIKMTKQEVKDEYKQMEGDPKVKGARKQKQMEMAQQRMMGNVKEADVVVRNPTHYAVALRYRIDEDEAPVVLAKGVDHIAARIVEEAEKHGVELVENPPLARGLYASSDILGDIPAEFFQPVAELLAWVYTTKKSKDTNKLSS